MRPSVLRPQDHRYATLAEGQVGWQLYRIWYEAERVHESLEYQTPHQRLTINV